MELEVTRMLVGLLVMAFHRRIADFILEQERVFVGLLHSRGLNFPAPPTPETTRNIYFGLGTFIVVWEMARIWLLLHS